MQRRSSRVRWCLFAALAAAFVLITGCSRLEILYSQADRLLLMRIDDYVDLTGEQRKRLADDIAALQAGTVVRTFRNTGYFSAPLVTSCRPAQSRRSGSESGPIGSRAMGARSWSMQYSVLRA